MVNKPVMAHIIDLLKKHGITEIVVTVQYLADDDPGLLRRRRRLRASTSTTRWRSTPLGTGGSVKNAEELLDEPFLVISGDALTDFDLTEIIAFHRQKKAMATLTLTRVPNPLEYGVVIVDETGTCAQFLEKPSWGEVFSDTVNTGIYVLEPEVLRLHRARARSSTSARTCSRNAAARTAIRSTATSPTATGATWATSRSTCAPAPTSCTGKVELAARSASTSAATSGWKDDVEIAPDAQLYGRSISADGVKIKGGVDHPRPDRHPRLHDRRHARQHRPQHHLAQLLHRRAGRAARRHRLPPVQPEEQRGGASKAR